jgi:hypothetical protein
MTQNFFSKNISIVMAECGRNVMDPDFSGLIRSDVKYYSGISGNNQVIHAGTVCLC